MVRLSHPQVSNLGSPTTSLRYESRCIFCGPRYRTVILDHTPFGPQKANGPVATGCIATGYENTVCQTDKRTRTNFRNRSRTRHVRVESIAHLHYGRMSTCRRQVRVVDSHQLRASSSPNVASTIRVPSLEHSEKDAMDSSLDLRICDKSHVRYRRTYQLYADGAVF